VLVEPQLGENIGMAARAMANFGLGDLRVVNPREDWPNARAAAAAAHAEDVVATARVFADLGAAVADLNLVLATTARPRELLKDVLGADEAAGRMAGHIAGGGRAGVLFGRERWGLTNEEVARADAIVTLPVVPESKSLNIAQTVVVVAYEWRKATAAALPFAGNRGEVATRAELEGLFGHLEGALDAAGFFPTDDMRGAMTLNLRSMLSRAGFNSQEVRTLRGVIQALERARRD
jgi:tRNA/rRNA methyltransferase